MDTSSVHKNATALMLATFSCLGLILRTGFHLENFLAAGKKLQIFPIAGKIQDALLNTFTSIELWKANKPQNILYDCLINDGLQWSFSVQSVIILSHCCLLLLFFIFEAVHNCIQISTEITTSIWKGEFRIWSRFCGNNKMFILEKKDRKIP